MDRGCLTLTLMGLENPWETVPTPALSWGLPTLDISDVHPQSSRPCLEVRDEVGKMTEPLPKWSSL